MYVKEYVMRALISVSDKTGIVELAKELIDLGVEIISTGGTYEKLREGRIPSMEISEITGYPECLDGRVKTLHPKVHAGLLAVRNKPEHMKQLEELEVDTIDFVIVNLYPFKETILREGVTRQEAIENIDIGGPAMLRSAAKNYQDVVVLVDPSDYRKVIEELRERKEVSINTRFYLMQKVFMHTAGYDALIAEYLKRERGEKELPEVLTMSFEKASSLRYGENPHQRAAFYKEIIREEDSLADAVQLHGKELSFNNINDTNGALQLLKEFLEPAVVGCKHGNPCGVGSADNITEAWKKAWKADKTSIFGGIVTLNREVNEEMALAMSQIFLEVVAAPAYEEKALEILQRKKNIRILQTSAINTSQSSAAYDFKRVNGGMLVQTIDDRLLEEDLQVVTISAPTKEQMKDLLFAWKVVKHVKSNGIVLAKNQQTIGIGAGQVNRIWAVKQAIEHGRELIGEESTKGSVLASDAFFPFADCVEEACKAGIKAVIQPGGSLRDEDSIKKCNEYGIAMVLTGIRHFKH
jgi:phosphoribosylaminoimidazolecarboxamide formyltransferase/IMP cyclohydrolase